MTATPRTDAVAFDIGHSQGRRYVMSDDARTLELELAAVTAERDRLLAELKQATNMRRTHFAEVKKRRTRNHNVPASASESNSQ